MRFPTKDELELLDPPLRDYWKEEINRYWSKQYQGYEKIKQEKDPLHGVMLAGIHYNHLEH